MRTFASTAIGLCFLVALAGFGFGAAGDQDLVNERLPSPSLDEVMAEGKEAFAGTCAACHRLEGQGMPGIFPPLAGSGAVDSLAHVDLVKKFGHRTAAEPVDLYTEVVRAASASGTAVEVSSAGLRKPVTEIYPAPAFLRMFYEAGVPVTLASDAHAPGDAGWGHTEVVAAARAAGYEERLGFSLRASKHVPLA